VTFESEDIQVYSTCEKTTDLFSLISKYDKIQHLSIVELVCPKNKSFLKIEHSLFRAPKITEIG